MASRPNILWIVTTQWRAQATGYAGDENAVTPNLDRLAAQSVRFRQAVSNHPFGPLARAALLTGLLSPANGVGDYFDPLPPQARSIAHDLNEAGYATAFVGKWHLAKRDPDIPVVGDGHARTEVPATARGGFSFWRGFESGFLLNDPWLHGTGLAGFAQRKGYQSDVLVDEMLGYLERASGPQFAVLSLEAPHPPYAADAAGIVRLDPVRLQLRANVPLGGAVERQARDELAGYYAHIQATDRALGRLLRDLDPERWAVVFTSAHGDMHGSHGCFRKGWPYEESIGVPLLIRSPGVASRVEGKQVASLVDLVPTTLVLAGVNANESRFHGRNLLGATNGTEVLTAMPTVPPFARQCPKRWFGARGDGWSLALETNGKPWLAHDLVQDPWQQTNLAESWSAEWEERRLRVWQRWCEILNPDAVRGRERV